MLSCKLQASAFTACTALFWVALKSTVVPYRTNRSGLSRLVHMHHIAWHAHLHHVQTS